MRIIKKLYHKDKNAVFMSSVFNEIVAKSELPMSFDSLEFAVGHGKTSILDNDAKLIIDVTSPLFKLADARIARTLINFELQRLFVQKTIGRLAPRAIEDLIIGKAMVRSGHADDLAYIFYILMANQRIDSMKSFIRFNLPWMVFRKEDRFYYDLFRQYAKTRPHTAYTKKSKKLFLSLQKNLLDTKNIEKCVKLYEEITHADD